MEEFPEDYHYILMGVGALLHLVGEITDAIITLFESAKNLKEIGKSIFSLIFIKMRKKLMMPM